MAYAKVKALRRAAKRGKGRDAALGLMFGATRGDGTFELLMANVMFWRRPIRQTGGLTGSPKKLRLRRS